LERVKRSEGKGKEILLKKGKQEKKVWE